MYDLEKKWVEKGLDKISAKNKKAELCSAGQPGVAVPTSMRHFITGWI
jgi:hypothetical protein